MQALFMILGIISLVISGVLQQYCEISRQSRPELRARAFHSRFGLLLEAGWIVLLLVGAVLMWFVHPIVGIIAVCVYWLLLPFSMRQRLRKRMLPPWRVVKGDLEKLGYTERNYWRGDWWKKEKAKEIQLNLKRRKRQDSDTKSEPVEE